MSTVKPGFQRARRPEHKELRAASIMEAARSLGLARGVRTVTLTDIAAEASINKSAVLRYFETREEIFLRLTAEGWTAWAEAMREATARAPHRTTGELARAFSTTLVGLPLFCDLLAHAPLTLERNVSREAVLSFKLTALGALDDIARTATDFLPELDSDASRQLAGAIAILAAGTWQVAHPPPMLAELYAERPELGHAVVDLEPQLRGYALALIAGLTTGRD